MSVPVILVVAGPRRPADGGTETVRLAGAGALRPYRYDGQHWRAGISALPKIITSLSWPGDDLGTGGVPQALAIGWSPATRAALDELAGLFWTDAAISIYLGSEGPAMPPLRLTGTVLEATADAGSMQIAMADPAAELKRPLLVDRFAGTGGAEGPAEWAGRIRRRAWGRCFNILGDPIDKANNIFCFGDPARAWQSFDAVRDRGVAADAGDLTLLAWQGSVAATFTALQAAVAEPGGGVLCPSIACIKWWAAPSSLCADVHGETAGGYVETAPEIAARIVAARSAITFAAGTVDAAKADRPAPCGWFVDDERTMVSEVLDRLLGDLSIVWVLNDGEILLRRWEWGGSAAAGRSDRVKRVKVHKPVGSRRLGYRRNQHLMARGDLADILFATDVTFPDGTLLSSVQPAEAGATNGTPPGSPAGPYEIGDLLDSIRAQALDRASLIGRLAGAIEKVDSVTKSVRVGQGQVLTPNSSYSEWQPGADLPDGYISTVKDAGTRRARVPGDAGNWAVMEITTAPDQHIGYEIDFNGLPPTWLELRAMVRLDSGGLPGAVLNLNAYDANGGFIANAFAPADASNDFEGGSAIKLSADPTTGNTAASMGVVGKTYSWRKLIKLTATNVAKLKMQVQTNSVHSGYGPNVPKVLVWHRAEVAIPDRAGTLTKINEARLSTTESVLADADNLEVVFKKNGSVSEGDSGADFFIEANAKKVDGTFTSNVAFGAQSIWFLNPDYTGPGKDYRKVFGVVDGVVYVLTKLVANTIEAKNFVNNATVSPARAQSSTLINGSWTTADANWPAVEKANVLFATIYMPEPGWIEATCIVRQGFTSGLTNRPWACDLSVGSETIDGTLSGGAANQDLVPLQGAYYAETAGYYQVGFNWGGHTTIVLGDRVLFVKGFPKTE